MPPQLPSIPAATASPSHALRAGARSAAATCHAADRTRIENFAIGAARDEAQTSKLGALQDVLAGVPTEESVTLLKTLLGRQRVGADSITLNPDEERFLLTGRGIGSWLLQARQGAQVLSE